VDLLDAAYWVKGCSSLGRLRYAVLLNIGQNSSKKMEVCLMDIKEAATAAAPHYPDARKIMPNAWSMARATSRRFWDKGCGPSAS
jgi:uncharacterized protein (DUF2252 family)